MKKHKIKGEKCWCALLIINVLFLITCLLLATILLSSKFSILIGSCGLISLIFQVYIVPSIIELRINSKFKHNLNQIKKVELKVVGYRFFKDYGKHHLRFYRKIWIELLFENKIYKIDGIQSYKKEITPNIGETVKAYILPNFKYAKKVADITKLKKSISEKKQEKTRLNFTRNYTIG